MNSRSIGYWTTTALLAFALLSGGVAEVVHRRDNLEGVVRLGYPLYFITILGVWKLLGGIAPLAPPTQCVFVNSTLRPLAIEAKLFEPMFPVARSFTNSVSFHASPPPRYQERGVMPILQD